MWWKIAGILVAVSLLLLLWPTRRRRLRYFFEEASAAMGRRDWPTFHEYVDWCSDMISHLPPGEALPLAARLDLLAAEAHYRQGRPSTSLGRLERAIAYFEPQPFECGAAMLAPAHRLWAEIEYDRGDLDKSEKHLRTAVECDQVAGDPQLQMMDLQRLGDILIAAGKSGQALAAAERCAELERRNVDSDLPGLGELDMLSAMLPEMCLARGEYERAEVLFREKLAYWTRVPSRAANVDVTRYQFHLAEAQRKAGRAHDAANTLFQAVATAERDFGSSHPRTALALAKLADALNEAGDPESAVLVRRRTEELRHPDLRS